MQGIAPHCILMFRTRDENGNPVVEAVIEERAPARQEVEVAQQNQSNGKDKIRHHATSRIRAAPAALQLGSDSTSAHLLMLREY